MFGEGLCDECGERPPHVGAFTACLPCINSMADRAYQEDRARREAEEKEEGQP